MPETTPPYQPGGQQGYPPPPYYYPPPKQKTRWWIPVVVIGGVLMLFIVGIIAFFGVLGSAIGSSFDSKPVAVKDNSVLSLKVSGILEEVDSEEGFAALASSGKRPATFMNTLEALRRAKDDANITGLYFEAGGIKSGFAKAAELRDAIIDFKTSGKFVYAFIEMGNESDYYFASVADSIFMPTEGLLEMNGYAAVVPFFKGALDKIGVNFHVQQFEEYKSAGETFNRTKFSDPAKEEYRALINQRYTTFVNDVAKSRKLDPSAVRGALDRGVYTTDTLLALGFIDALRSRERVKDDLLAMLNSNLPKEDTLKNLRLVSVKNYINSSSFGKDKKDKIAEGKGIAIVFGSGAIVTGTSEKSLFNNENNIASESFIKSLRKARDNDEVDAIILRIDSPGGSVIASDAIWEEIQAARKVKPVYASMSDMAASGGYYMAMACDTIIAHPLTITGSIGVILSLPNITGALDKLGITVDTITTSSSAKFLNPMLPLTDADKQKLYMGAEQIYKRFVSRVAESRGMSFDETRAIAKGRVWTGEEAKKVGLVDVLGGLQESINLAKKRIGVDPETKVAVHVYPEAEDPVAAILRFFDVEDEEASLSSEMSRSTQPSIEQTAFWQVLPASLQTHVRYALQLNAIATKEPAMMALPTLVDIH